MVGECDLSGAGFVVDFLCGILGKSFIDSYKDGAIVIFEVEKRFLGVFARRTNE